MEYRQLTPASPHANRQFFYKVLAGLLFMLALVQLSTAVVSFGLQDKVFWQFLISAVITALTAAILQGKSGPAAQIKKRYLFLLTTLCWLLLCFFAAIPLYLSLPEISLTDAWFETVSAVTTTGSTVLSNLEQLPKGVLFWRAMLQWIGGIGIIVMAIAILPVLKIGGMKLFKTENSDISEKILPRSSSLSSSILLVYLLLTALAMSSYYLGGMSGFDAVTHGMTSVATGGFANYDASFGFFNDKPWLLWLSSLWMFLAALPFVLYVGMLRGDRWILIKDPQVRAFCWVIAITVIWLTLYQHWHNERDWFSALTHSLFNVISVVTTCGYASEDYTLWGNFAFVLFFYLTFSGGCSGSTSGGLKVFRTQLASFLLLKQLKILIHPKAVWTQRYGSKKVDDELLGAVLAFCFIYFATIAALAMVLAMYELDFVTALSSAATAVSNVGPGLGDTVGPAGNFASLPNGAKWWLSVGMLAGRLEILTLLLLFSPMYWRN
ncbi:Trk system potassium uptake protein [Alishewanella longhuensis]|uniref:Trk system potassium uptake protein n=1 Tax=Alishewanella longhuensis TaxID=1091037 RepID=A0ABQ3L1A4_9ALTE|nr:TrkH family potassium uptake protein [Alishewanella longhuensis]GHG71432.1 Trk system potassium uptake protein [Alishewanella longhuensis]